MIEFSFEETFLQAMFACWMLTWYILYRMIYIEMHPI